MKIGIVIFDAGGVVLKPSSFSKVLERDYKITFEMTSLFFRGIFGDCLKGKADLKTELKPFLQQWGWPHDLEEFLNLWFQKDTVINHELLKIIQTLKKQGIITCLATNQEQYRSDYLKEQKELSLAFTHFFSSSMAGALKPDNDYFDYISQILSGNRSEIMFWDDSVDNVQAARDYGWKAEIYTTLSSFTADLEKLKLYSEG